MEASVILRLTFKRFLLEVAKMGHTAAAVQGWHWISFVFPISFQPVPAHPISTHVPVDAASLSPGHVTLTTTVVIGQMSLLLVVGQLILKI